MQVNLSELTWASFVYPRGGKNEKTVEAYVDALSIGAQFPPIKIQKVFNYPKDNEKIEATLILDGIHRWFAFKECGLKKIKAIQWKKEALDYETSRIRLLLEAAKCNIRHGDRLSPKDRKQIARDIATSDPECTWTEDALAEKLGVIRQTINIWISDIRTRQRAGRDIIIIRLSRLGWTQEQVAEIVGMTQGRVAQIINNANFSDINSLVSHGRDMDYIARHYHMDLALAWALRLEGKPDQEKFKELGWGLPREIRESDSETYFTGGCAHGINGISMNAMNDSETTGPGEYRRNSLLTHCFISQNPAILFLILWPAAALSLMYAFSLSENVNPLILPPGRTDRKLYIIIGTLKMDIGPLQKSRI